MAITFKKVGTQQPGVSLQGGGSGVSLQGGGTPQPTGGTAIQGSSQPIQGSLINPNDYRASDSSSSASSGDGSGGSGGVSTGPSDSQVNPLLEAIASLDSIRQNALNAARDRFNKFGAQYDTEDANDLATYNRQVDQNEMNLASNRQAALLAAAQGGRGLRAVLASLGALSGTGSQLADRAIANSANLDLGDAQDSFETNVDTLGSAWQQTEREQRQRRLDAEAALENDRQAAESTFLTSKQGILGKLADLFGAGTARGNQYASEAASLYAPLARTSRTAVSDYARPDSLYSQQNLDTYKAGAGDLTVKASGGGNSNSNSSVFTTTQRKKDELS